MTETRVTIDQPPIEDLDGARKRLRFFAVMAITVGIGLLLLTLEVILHYGFSNDALSWWPTPHGFIFMVYVLSVALLGFKVGWSLPKILLVMLAGCVPFLSFWVERKMVAETEARMAASGPGVRSVG